MSEGLIFFLWQTSSTVAGIFLFLFGVVFLVIGVQDFPEEMWIGAISLLLSLLLFTSVWGVSRRALLGLYATYAVLAIQAILGAGILWLVLSGDYVMQRAYLLLAFIMIVVAALWAVYFIRRQSRFQ